MPYLTFTEAGLDHLKELTCSPGGCALLLTGRLPLGWMVRVRWRTRGLIGAAELALMKTTAWLVNTSRGPIVEEGALVQALGRAQ